jgi:hypothetical protein
LSHFSFARAALTGGALFAVKNLPFADISAQRPVFCYDAGTSRKQRFKEETVMRHVYIRGILALTWLAAAVVSGVSGNLELTGLYVLMGAAFGYSACASRKKAKSGKGER